MDKKENSAASKSSMTYRIVLINIICLLIYTIGLKYLYQSGGECVVYKTNAAEINEILYQGVIEGKIPVQKFTDTLEKMEQHINRIAQNENAVILAHRAVIMGGKEIVFSNEGKIKKHIKKGSQEKTNVRSPNHQRKNMLKNTIDTFLNSSEENLLSEKGVNNIE